MYLHCGFIILSIQLIATILEKIVGTSDAIYYNYPMLTTEAENGA